VRSGDSNKIFKLENGSVKIGVGAFVFALHIASLAWRNGDGRLRTRSNGYQPRMGWAKGRARCDIKLLSLENVKKNSTVVKQITMNYYNTFFFIFIQHFQYITIHNTIY
jgi:hypothetical protein